MATLHIRNVPDRVVTTLKRMAQENGRSLNAEVVQALADYDERHTQAEELLQQLEEFRAELTLPENAPTPEDVIREARDERTREIDRRVRGL